MWVVNISKQVPFKVFCLSGSEGKSFIMIKLSKILSKKLSQSRDLIVHFKGQLYHLLSYSLIKNRQLVSRRDKSPSRHKLDRSHKVLSNVEIDEILSCFGDQQLLSSDAKNED